MAEKDKPLIKIFTTPTCSFCKVVKGYLYSLQIEFKEISLEAHPKHMQWLVENTGQIGVPVTVFNDKNFVIGWQKEEIDNYLRELNLIK